MMPIEANPEHLAELEGIKAFKPETIEALKNKSLKEVRDIIVAEFGIKSVEEIETYQKQAKKQGEKLTLLQAEFRLSHMLESKQKMLTIETTLNALMERTDRGLPVTPKPAEFADAFKRHGSYYKIKGDPHLYHKVGNIYKPDAKESVQELTERFYPDATAGFVSETVRKLEHRNPIDRDNFDADHRIIPCPNIVLSLDGKMAPAGYLATKQIATEYKPELGISEKFLKFLDEIMPDPEARAGLLEVCSTILLRGSINHEKYHVFVGSGSNGKSILLRVLNQVLGSDNVSHVPWQRLEGRFGASKLEGMFANIFYDLEPHALDSTSTIKSLVSQEPIFVERKGIDGHDMIFNGRIFFSCNTLPEIKNMQKADLRRIFLFRFDEVFEGESKDITLLEALTKPAERSRILNTLLAEARKVLDAGQVTYTQSEHDIKRLWKLNSSSSLAFSAGLIQENNAPKIKTGVLYTEYEAWCKMNNQITQSRTVFNKCLTDQNFVMDDTTVNGEKTTYWFNVVRKADKSTQARF